MDYWKVAPSWHFWKLLLKNICEIILEPDISWYEMQRVIFYLYIVLHIEHMPVSNASYRLLLQIAWQICHRDRIIHNRRNNLAGTFFTQLKINVKKKTSSKTYCSDSFTALGVGKTKAEMKYINISWRKSRQSLSRDWSVCVLTVSMCVCVHMVEPEHHLNTTETPSSPQQKSVWNKTRRLTLILQIDLHPDDVWMQKHVWQKPCV